MTDDFIEEFIEELEGRADSEDYNPDEFYQIAVDNLSLYGFELKNEFLEEYCNDEHYHGTDEPHFEVISEFKDSKDDELVYVRFLLQDCALEYDVPDVKVVEDKYQFTEIPQKV